jgi:hypothetical protein
MLEYMEALRKDHERLRALLHAWDEATAPALPGLLQQLRDHLTQYQQDKSLLFDKASRTCQLAGDMTGMSLLSIFRTNMEVFANAVKNFFMHVEPDPARLQRHFRTVADSLRSMMVVDEKSIIPLCMRHWNVAMDGGRGSFPLRPGGKS